MSEQPSSPFAQKRKTLGLITSAVNASNVESQWLGQVRAARQSGVNFVAFVGGTIGLPQDRIPNTIYPLARHSSLDGLTIWAGNMLWNSTQAEMDEFVRSFAHVPLVTVEKVVEGVQAVLLEDYVGMRQIVKHLIADHGRRRILFLRGPEEHFGAQERFQAYRDALAEAAIPFNPQWVSPDASWIADEDRMRAMFSVFSRPGEDFDAVVGASCFLANAAMNFLLSEGVSIPESVSIVGFDDAELNLLQTPTLTTIRSPFQPMGKLALETLLARVEGQALPPIVTQPTQLVIRQSCGCVETLLAEAAAAPLDWTPASAAPWAELSAQKETWIPALLQAMISQVSPIHVSTELNQLGGEVEGFLQAFFQEIQEKQAGAFLKFLQTCLAGMVHRGEEINIWQSAISSLRAFVIPYVLGEELAACENLWNQARVLVSEMAERALVRRILAQRTLAEFERGLSTELFSATNLNDAMDSLAGILPLLGIENFYLSLYDGANRPEEEAELRLALMDGRRQPIASEEARYPAAQILPEGFIPQDRLFSWLVQALHFQDRAIGFVVFELGPENPHLYETLRLQISSALYKIFLIEAELHERRLAEMSLRQEQQLMQAFMDNLPDLVYFKDTQSRFTRMNRAMLNHFKLKSPDDLLGKTDFDIFTDEHARPAYEDEQEIIRTGKPILDKEEREIFTDGRLAWASTTKMPLRDSQGKIIGTFGVSRNITARKKAEEELAFERDLLKALLDNVPDHIFFKDRQARIIRSNLAHARSLGFSDPQQLIGKTDFDLFGNAAQTYFEQEQRVMEEKAPLINAISNPTYATGQNLWLSENKLPILDANGNVTGLVGISRDITSLKQAELQLERRSLQLQTAAEVSQAASNILDPQELIGQAVNLIRERFDLYYVGLFLVDQNGDLTNDPGHWAVLQAGTGEAGAQMLAYHHKLEITDTSMIGWCIANKQGRIALDVGQDAVRFRNPYLPSTRSELALPLINRNEVIGALTIQSAREAAFTPEDISIFQTMADQLANAIANARLYEQMQLTLRDMQATSRRYISQGWKDYVRTRTTTGYKLSPEGVAPLGAGLLPEAARVLRDQQPVVNQRKAESVLSAPINLRDQPIGVLSLHDPNAERTWTQDEIDLVQQLSEQFALAAENLRLFDETQRRAERERLVSEITTRLRASNDPKTILQTAVDELRTALRVKDARVKVVAPAETSTVSPAAFGEPPKA